jgi:hypothetical protein
VWVYLVGLVHHEPDALLEIQVALQMTAGTHRVQEDLPLRPDLKQWHAVGETVRGDRRLPQ